jgi:hypothetical protein
MLAGIDYEAGRIGMATVRRIQRQDILGNKWLRNPIRYALGPSIHWSRGKTVCKEKNTE